MTPPQPTIAEFGIKRDNEERRDGGCAVVFDPQTQKYAVWEQSTYGIFRLFSGGVDPEEGIQEGILREVREESGLHDFDHWIYFFQKSMKRVEELGYNKQI